MLLKQLFHLSILRGVEEHCLCKFQNELLWSHHNNNGKFDYANDCTACQFKGNEKEVDPSFVWNRETRHWNAVHNEHMI